ncbi:MAG: class I SAM-dependent methyltransferase [Candidatus Absconditabacterales bacterium]
MTIWKQLHKIRIGCRQGLQIIFAYTNTKPNDLTRLLAHFYTNQAQKRTDTRKKHRPEFDHILSDIQNSVVAQAIKTSKSKLRIVELGCGDGRFADYLDQHLHIPFSYVGVDCAKGLISIAQEREYKHDVSFLVGDMTGYLESLTQESVDIIISIASIQHLHKSARQACRNNAYRVLKYEGLHITTNRSYSRWMLHKHRDMMIIGFILQLLNGKTFGRHDYMIPFKTPIGKEEYNIRNQPVIVSVAKQSKQHDIATSQEKTKQGIHTSYRFYHIYLLGELITRARTAGFVVQTATYVSAEGILIDNRKNSRNTYIVAVKDVGLE